MNLLPEEIHFLLKGAAALPELLPDECLDNTKVHTHGGYSPTRTNASSVICRSLSFVIDHEYDNGFYIPKDSSVWTASDWGRKITQYRLATDLTTPLSRVTAIIRGYRALRFLY